MYKITKEFKWDMAHRLPSHKWKCFNVHWHTYKCLITFMWEEVQKEWAEEWMVRDFWNLKQVKEWIDENWDHSYVGKVWDEVLEFLKDRWYRTFTMEDNPTAENMSKLLYEICSKFIPNVRLDKVVVYETPTSFAEYTTTNELPF